MKIEKIKEKHEHNQMMIDLTYSLIYIKFDDVNTKVLKIKCGISWHKLMEEKKIC